MSASSSAFDKALAVGRPPNVQALFPHSRALIVSGKVVDRAMLEKGKCMTIAANGRSSFVIRGALMGAQRANAALIIEIARSEGGANAYCHVNLWNLASHVNNIVNELGLTIPVAIHADHYGVKKPEDIGPAKEEIPSLFETGVTSIALDASHMPDDQNLLANLELDKIVPSWAGYETEVGEIKGKLGLSTPEEALFLIKGLNAHGVHPDWIALNNGSIHGLEAEGEGIQVDLTREIHDALAPYKVSGAQHGTSGNSSERLRAIAEQTRTTKANVATALQMISWGVKVNDYGNAILDDNGDFIKEPDKGVSDLLWKEMTDYAEAHGIKGGNYKKLNLPFECRLMGQPKAIRDRMANAVADFTYDLLVNVFNAKDTAPIAIDLLNQANSYDLGHKATVIEDPAEWTEAKIKEKAAAMETDKGPEGDFDD